MSSYSELIRTMVKLDDTEEDSDGSDSEDIEENIEAIPLANVDSKIFNEILKFFKILLKNEPPKIPKPLTDSNMEKVLGENGKVYAEYVSSYDTETIFEIILAVIILIVNHY